MTRAGIGLLVAAALAVGCGEKPQTATNAVRKSDAQAWNGAENPYVASGWKAGDQASWDEQMRARARKQNEYVRIAN